VSVRAAQLQGLCEQLGTEVATPRLNRLLVDVGLQAGQETPVGFEAFLRIVALLLDEEAEANPDMAEGSNMMQGGYYSEDGPAPLDVDY